METNLFDATELANALATGTEPRHIVIKIDEGQDVSHLFPHVVLHADGSQDFYWPAGDIVHVPFQEFRDHE